MTSAMLQVSYQRAKPLKMKAKEKKKVASQASKAPTTTTKLACNTQPAISTLKLSKKATTIRNQKPIIAQLKSNWQLSKN